MASQYAFIIIEPNYFFMTQSCLFYNSISINFIILSIQSYLLFLYTHTKFVCLSVHNHYWRCLPIKNHRLWNIKTNMVLKTQFNLLLFPMVPIICLHFILTYFIKKKYLLTKIIGFWVFSGLIFSEFNTIYK